MNIPSFTAKLSLYKSTAHYLPLRSTAVNMNGAIVPTMEVIDVVSCGPGLIQFGEGADINCVNPLDLFGGGGGGETPVPMGDGPRGPRGGGGGVKPPKTPPKRPPRVIPGPDNKQDCKTECSAKKPFNRDWSVACDDYCNCLWDTKNPITNCNKEFMDDTKTKKPPFSR